jgi:hypothetical protein
MLAPLTLNEIPIYRGHKGVHRMEWANFVPITEESGISRFYDELRDVSCNCAGKRGLPVNPSMY